MNRRLWRYRFRATGRPGRTERNVHTDSTAGFIFLSGRGYWQISLRTANERTLLHKAWFRILIFPFLRPDGEAESATREQAALLHPAFCSRVVHTLPKICAQNPGAGLNLWIYYKGLLHFSINHLLNIIFYRIRIIESEMEIFFVRGTINYFH